MADAGTRLERRAITKISWRLLPLLGACYLVAIIDRGNVSFASVSMNAELKFSEAVYGLGVACFFISYALFEVPSNLLLNRFGARRWLARIMVTWGIVSMAMVFVRTPWEFYGLRFLLGMAEAGFFPGVTHYVSEWMPAHQRGRAISRFYIASALALVALGASAPPLLGLHGLAGLSGWQWLFIVQGLPAVLLGVALLFALPDRYSEAAWLEPEEKAWLDREMALGTAATGAAPIGIGGALLQPIVLVAGTALALNFAVGSAIGFSLPKLMTDQMHWSIAQAGKMTVVSGVLVGVAMLIAGVVSDRMARPSRLVAILMLVTAAGGMMILFGGTTMIAAAGGVIFTVAGQVAGLVILITLTRFIHPTARAAGIAMSNTLGQIGAAIGPALWGLAASATGSFSLGLLIASVVMAFAALIAWSIELVTARKAPSPVLSSIRPTAHQH
ncbi:MFS transporter [Sphingomonas sp. 28-63-12]|uniref:MFS transporter n=1 Tax=Sphingomonas sp. 28-63-12 TaxID=1970434 RepID=UPI0035A8F0D4